MDRKRSGKLRATDSDGPTTASCPAVIDALFAAMVEHLDAVIAGLRSLEAGPVRADSAR
jgi:hypothetical protein